MTKYKRKISFIAVGKIVWKIVMANCSRDVVIKDDHCLDVLKSFVDLEIFNCSLGLNCKIMPLLSEKQNMRYKCVTLIFWISWTLKIGFSTFCWVFTDFLQLYRVSQQVLDRMQSKNCAKLEFWNFLSKKFVKLKGDLHYFARM